jgi:hypothetical protein
MAIEAAILAHWQFEIHQSPGLQTRERCSRPRLLREIGGKRIIRDVNRRQANAAHGYAVTLLQFPCQLRASDRKPTLHTRYFDRLDLPNVFDDSSEH